MRVFLETWEEVQAHNAKEGNSYQMGINQFSALSEKEFAAKYLSKFEPHHP